MNRALARLLLILACLLARPAATRAQGPAPDAAAQINSVLDAWHAAADRADEAAYFGAFTPDAVFMGTDATERWTVAQFRAYAHPYFAKGKAWTYHPRDRHLAFSDDQHTAWFDEALDSPHMGECRGTGVVVLLGGAWKIAHYNLTIPVPNDLAKDLVRRIAEFGAAHGAPAEGSVRVITFNIRYANPEDGENRWEKRRENMAAFLREQRPDVVGLQEALRTQLDDLTRALPEMGEIGVGRDDGKTAGEYAAILYRKDRWKAGAQGTFWLSDTPETPGSKGWGNNVVRICTWARLEPVAASRGGGAPGAFYVFNVHLDHESQASRERSVALLLERIAARPTPEPVIVTGDFNAPEDNAAVRAMTGEATSGNRALRFRDSFRVLHPDEKVSGTFNSFRGESSGPKIDYIFVPGDGVRVTEATIHRARPGDHDLSDHFPVSAVLVLPARGAAR